MEIRIFADTNIMISGIYFNGIEAKLLDKNILIFTYQIQY